MFTRHQIATHESGHAVAALLLGRPYGCIIDPGESGGRAGPDTTDLTAPTKAADYSAEALAGTYGDADLRDTLDFAAITAAGRVAEGLDAGENRRFVFVSGFDARLIDAAAFAVLGDDAGPHELREFHRLCLARAWRLLAPVWFRVQSVAAALSQRGRLTADQVREIFESASAGVE
jgi:hypothetical protein